MKILTSVTNDLHKKKKKFKKNRNHNIIIYVIRLTGYQITRDGRRPTYITVRVRRFRFHNPNPLSKTIYRMYRAVLLSCPGDFPGGFHENSVSVGYPVLGIGRSPLTNYVCRDGCGVSFYKTIIYIFP